MMTDRPRVLAVSASLRSARRGRGVDDLLAKLKELPDEEAFFGFVSAEAEVHYQQFIEAGRKQGLAFDVIFRNLRRLSGRKGLSNSEIGVAAALWAAHRIGCEIDYLPLSDHFGPHETRNIEQLEKRVLRADALVLGTPVYFGDRSSLAASFIEFLRANPVLHASLAGKPVVGVAVGAKRNGGQETTLIYQLAEFVSLGMLGVGNDSETTSQYGGTIVAGDIGEGAKDRYGLKTAIGAGRRVARIAMEQKQAAHKVLKSPLRVAFWILQDAGDFARGQVDRLLGHSNIPIEARILSMDRAEVSRCIACDICPTHVGPDAEYRCIIQRRSDALVEHHEALLDPDLIVPVAYSPRDRRELHSNYQRFMERTRYIRRGDYMFTDAAVLPLVFEELGTGEYMPLRILTSMIRHHTVILQPATGYMMDGKLLNEGDVQGLWRQALEQARSLTIGRLTGSMERIESLSYNPVGYILSAAKDRELSVADRRKMLQDDRIRRSIADAERRIGAAG